MYTCGNVINIIFLSYYHITENVRFLPEDINMSENSSVNISSSAKMY